MTADTSQGMKGISVWKDRPNHTSNVHVGGWGCLSLHASAQKAVTLEWILWIWFAGLFILFFCNPPHLTGEAVPAMVPSHQENADTFLLEKVVYKKITSFQDFILPDLDIADLEILNKFCCTPCFKILSAWITCNAFNQRSCTNSVILIPCVYRQTISKVSLAYFLAKGFSCRLYCFVVFNLWVFIFTYIMNTVEIVHTFDKTAIYVYLDDLTWKAFKNYWDDLIWTVIYNIQMILYRLTETKLRLGELDKIP